MLQKNHKKRENLRKKRKTKAKTIKEKNIQICGKPRFYEYNWENDHFLILY